MSSTRGYHSYRGRASRGKIALGVLLVLVILVAFGVIWTQRYVVFDESGHAHLELPWQQEETKQQEKEKDPPLDLTIETPKPKTVRGLGLAGNQMPAELPVTDPELNAVILTGKNPDGAVLFPSPTAGTTEGFTKETVNALRERCPQVAVRLTACLDPAAAKADLAGKALVRKDTGRMFYDSKNRNWLDLGKPAARTYLCSLAKELAEMGVDEILLSELGYPGSGRLTRIAYDEAEKAAQVRLFLTELKETLKPYEVKLSLELPAEVLTTGRDSARGLLLSDAAGLADRIYAVAAPEQAAPFTAAVQAVRKETEFVPILADAAQVQGLENFLILPG